jgi:hypothetical protein
MNLTVMVSKFKGQEHGVCAPPSCWRDSIAVDSFSRRLSRGVRDAASIYIVLIEFGLLSRATACRPPQPTLPPRSINYPQAGCPQVGFRRSPMPLAVTSKKEKAGAVAAAMSDFLCFCATCKTVYEIVRHRVRPPAEPVCEVCQQDLPLADDGDWLTYRRTLPRFERTG